MPNDRRLYVGPRLRRLRRDLGLTQADMAADLEVSASYIALLERNNRPLTADLLVRLARTYKIDMSVLAGQDREDDAARLQAVLKDPMFADIDLPAMETADVAGNFPGITEALLRLYTTYQEEQLALADRSAESGVAGDEAPDPVAESRRFLAARRNCFEGNEGWLNQFERGRDYAAGDLWGCVGLWFSGRWYYGGAIEYTAEVRDWYNQRIWETPGFKAG